jgi:hypothetical protein
VAPRRVMAAAHATPPLAATNKCLAQGNKSSTGGKATKNMAKALRPTEKQAIPKCSVLGKDQHIEY